MERVLYDLHTQVCSVALRRTSSRTRILGEYSVLVLAICGFGALVLSHLSFVYRPKAFKNIPRSCLSNIKGYNFDADVTHLMLLPSDGADVAGYAVTVDNQDALLNSTTFTSQQAGDASSCLEKNPLFPPHYVYAQEKGYLLLSAELCRQKDISLQYVYVSRKNSHCFGEPFLQRLIRLIGPDTVMINWVLGLKGRSTRGGHDDYFVYNPRTKKIVDYKAVDSKSTAFARHFRSSFVAKLSVIFKAFVVFFITTTLVSFTLRETQARMLEFTIQLQAHVRAQQSLVHLVTTHVIGNLVFVPIMVGMMFFLIEFYQGDKFLAFVVMSIVWVCEVFSAISLRSLQGIHFFPCIFFLLFSLFHVYLFSCPHGFVYLALTTTVCFMLHSMLFFWNRYELPTVARGVLSSERPRMLSEDRGVVMPPQPPSTPQPSHPTSEAVQPPRRSTSGGSISLYHDGGDDDASYVYFMDGEVVVHRNSRRSSSRRPSASNGGESISSHSDDPVAVSFQQSNAAIPPGESALEGYASPSHSVNAAGSFESVAPPSSRDDHQYISTPVHDNLSSTPANQEEIRIRQAPTFPTLEDPGSFTTSNNLTR